MTPKKVFFIFILFFKYFLPFFFPELEKVFLYLKKVQKFKNNN